MQEFISSLSRNPQFIELSSRCIKALDDLKSTMNEQQISLFVEYIGASDDLRALEKDLLLKKITQEIEIIL